METNGLWAKVALMGHVELAGRISKSNEFEGLWQLDIPQGDTFRTEFFSTQAIYRLQPVSEEIARAYASSIGNSIIEYNAPIITREEHVQRMEIAQTLLQRVERENEELRRRLTAVNALPAPMVLRDEEESKGEEDDFPL